MQNQRLDEYMAQLEAILRHLSPEKRDEEMREVRQHLESLAQQQMQLGKSTDDAVDSALQQFGHPLAIGRGLHKAAQKGRVKSPALFVAKFIAFKLTLFAAFFLFFYSMADKPTDFPYTLQGKLIMAAMYSIAFTASVAFGQRMRRKHIASK